MIDTIWTKKNKAKIEFILKKDKEIKRYEANEYGISEINKDFDIFVINNLQKPVAQRRNIKGLIVSSPKENIDPIEIANKPERIKLLCPKLGKQIITNLKSKKYIIY